MPIKGNKGEWSEFYAFIKILTDKKIFAANENLEILQGKVFSVLKIIREEAKMGINTYDIETKKNAVVIYNEENKMLGTVQSEKIKKSVSKIFEKMKQGGEATFAISSADQIMKELFCTQIKASSGSKSDLTLIIHDRISSTLPELGFSIKSMLGSPSTLLNASGATNFVYCVENLQDNKTQEINNVEGHSKLRDRAKIIYGSKGKLIFEGLDNDSFKKNLCMIDTILPEILAELLKIYYDGKASTMRDLVDILSHNKELSAKYGFDKEVYEFKIKNFLVAIALGMTPNKKWDGFTKAHGGYIIVREDGELVCYHLYNRDEFQNYLYKNTKLDTPSTTRHKFGSIYEENGEKKVKYNLQIRFIK
jgi:type II restriction enzyme